ncbi:hypothetical protein Acsp06_65210 [Actinomycetospora sp. NBRC 106375]|uniref:hypothetical protein n=1 Tax=Actinomycetospora sp. NBRC 106375 TaxID=3032207 RepID=UPI0024A0ED02|nr:hypothetical protein [Actinomycetospora sp. NBRC 106375]GLZ50336.1 hypothetical protein Acsp06_65210 [Actinomycetospora sp. NBRC 106375]
MSAEDIGADELLARLGGNDPRVHVADPDPAVRAVWRRAIDAVRREHLTPPGMRLRHTGRDRGDLVIWLEPVEQAPPVRPDRLLVPSEIVEAHPLLGSPEELGTHLDVEPASLPRALRLLQVFIETAEARHYTVAWAAAFSTLALDRDGHTETVECGEEREHRAVAPTAAELGDKAPRYSWQRVQTEQRWVATGRLCMQLGDDGDRRGRRRRWADRTRWRLEDKLANVLAEIDRRVDDAVARRQAQQEQSRQREVRWDEAIEHARRAFGEQRRRDELLRQVEAWHDAERIRAFTRTLAARADRGEHPGDRAEVDAWVDWADAYAESIDPLVAGCLAPEEIEATAEQLRPHLRGWSPYGPDQR